MEVRTHDAPGGASFQARSSTVSAAHSDTERDARLSENEPEDVLLVAGTAGGDGGDGDAQWDAGACEDQLEWDDGGRWLPGAGQPGPDHGDELADAGDRDEDEHPGQRRGSGAEVLVSGGGIQCRGAGSVEFGDGASGDVKGMTNHELRVAMGAGA